MLEHAELAGRADADGRTLLHWCAIWNRPHHIEVCKALLNAGANPFSIDSMGRTAMHWAGVSGSCAMIDTLRHAISDAGSSDHDAYHSVADDFGRTPEDYHKQPEFTPDHERATITDATNDVRDPSFPPSLMSLAQDPTKLPSQFMAVQWLLPSQMVDDLAGCGGALFGALSASPTASAESLPNNGWCVKCSHRGEEQKVYVDGYIPCIQGRPAFGSTRADLAALYIQKAYAKLSGSYEWLLRSDWAPKSRAADAPLTSQLGYVVPRGSVDEHPLARLSMSHAITTAEALYNGAKNYRKKGGWFGAEKPEAAGKKSTGFFRDTKQDFVDGIEYLNAFSSDFAGNQAEINRLDSLVTNVKPPAGVAAGGPAQTTLIGRPPSLLIHVQEECWVRIVAECPGGDHSIFLNVYQDGGETWLQEASGYAKQTMEGYVLDLNLKPCEKGYRVVASCTLAAFASEFSMHVESTSELTVQEQF